jgi:hypothetical protein
VLLDLGLVAHADLLAAVAIQQGIEVSLRPTKGLRTADATGDQTPAAAPTIAKRPRPRVLLWAAVVLALLGAGIAIGNRLASVTTSSSSAIPR